jgi:hypothetical protein
MREMPGKGRHGFDEGDELVLNGGSGGLSATLDRGRFRRLFRAIGARSVVAATAREDKVLSARLLHCAVRTVSELVEPRLAGDASVTTAERIQK